jgi:hypothetical protein
MKPCNNCDTPFDPDKEGLLTTSKGATVAAVCGGCCADVRVGKLVLRKPEVGTFTYEQWSPMEMTTSGLSTNKRVG